jgi:hypothetical protein
VIQFRDGMVFKGSQKVGRLLRQGERLAGGVVGRVPHACRWSSTAPSTCRQSNRPPEVGKGDRGRGEAKVDVVYCYPAPADSADRAQEKEVSYEQVERDPVTDRPVRRQKIVAQRTDPARAGPRRGRRRAVQAGPGRGAGEGAELGAGRRRTTPRPRHSGQRRPARAETEMKLTIVNFSGRMTAKDKGSAYQEATFIDNGPRSIHLPSDNPDLVVERHRMPPKATLLTCSKELDRVDAQEGERADGAAHARRPETPTCGTRSTTGGVRSSPTTAR